MPRSRSRSPASRKREGGADEFRRERERDHRRRLDEDVGRRSDEKHRDRRRSVSRERARERYKDSVMESTRGRTPERARERGKDRDGRPRVDDDGRRRRSRRSRSRSSSSDSSSDSGSGSDSGSDDGSEDGRRRKRRRDKDREGRRSRSRSRSRERVRDRSRERRKEKDRKRRKEEKRERRKRKEEKRTKKAAKKARKEGGSKKTFGYYGILNESDINTKDSEFRAWLIEERKMNPETVPNSKMKDLFRSFAEDWNTVTLPDKYYNLEAHERMLRSIANGDTLPGDEGIYDFRLDEADISRRARAAAVPTSKNEDHLTYEALQELRRIQRERVEGTQLKRLGLQGKESLGVRYE